MQWNNKTNDIPLRLCEGDNLADDPHGIGNLFIIYFTNIKSSNVTNIDDYIEYTDKSYANMFNDHFPWSPSWKIPLWKNNLLQ